MKACLQLFILAVSITAANAQNDALAPAYSDEAAPTLVYETPVVYNAQVVYQAPVVYNAPVYYGATPYCAPAPVDCRPDCAPVSTVLYIGNGHVAYQESPRCNSGSTVTYIGGH